MNAKLFICGLLCLIGIVRGKQTLQPAGRKIILPNSEISNTINSFAWKLFKGSKPVNPVDNLILSPISLQFLLALLETAAEGETKRQLQFITGYKQMATMSDAIQSGSGRDGNQLETAAGIFVDSALQMNETFVQTAAVARASVRPLDFRRAETAKESVNQWAAEATHGAIDTLIGPSYDIAGTEILLTSAIYFQGTWKYSFQPSTPETFYTFLKRGPTAEFMELTQNFLYEELVLGGGVRGDAVGIPYEDEENYMILIVPSPGVTLNQFMGRFTPDHFESLMKALPDKAPQYMTLKMPKFKVESKFSVVNSLLKMGLVDLFTSNCELPYIAQNYDAKVTDVLQQAVLDVNEKGTTASAATAVFAYPFRASSDGDFKLTVNKPFVAVILDKRNRAPLFISKIYQPTN